ncbi:phosphatidylinositol 3 and 4-kinase-domain-containing protein [Dunaliella salina]|uniref:1-phosphatidylinositol 4-kinase n=1 Tax=Dunaliella salina TaxID=3046 RepID=A0ABQ7GCP9_DUNSA|nr:phosphatidylinositol 3 and 4-kinase-domain-containing protein [Dunaliella salina]|eukprot:KAF5832392.1 phosphatidylinositol 3 and 4-kinase-domain-containing protein [Dunaliella salina]
MQVPRETMKPPIFAAAKSAAETTPPPGLPVGSKGVAGKLRDGESSAKSKGTGTPTPTRADQLGWQGLLEFSRSSGAAGVLYSGISAGAEERNKRSDAEIEICCTAHTNTRVRHLVKSVIRGLKACQEPERPREGMGGTYFFMNENGRKVGILKPCDEEPLAPNNPKGYVGRQLGDPGWKPTVRVGEAAMREVAAYLLDHDGWAKVPTSVLVRARHPIFCYNNRMSSVRASSLDLVAKDAGVGEGGEESSSKVSQPLMPMKLGSLQEFVWHDCDTSEMGTSRFSASDVHRIGILDIRLFNTDRHAGNMLVRMPRESSATDLKSRIADAKYELIPIDHGFCLPETFEAPYFEWLHWPQAMLPFSEEELAYIKRIDIEADKEILRKELPNLRPECLRVLEISTLLLKHCADAGLTLFEIASIVTRPFEGGGEDLSDLEKFASYARSVVDSLTESSEDASSSIMSSSDDDESGSEGDRVGGRHKNRIDEDDDEELDGVTLAAILDNVDEHGPYYGASSPDAGDDDVFGYDRSSDAVGSHQPATHYPTAHFPLGGGAATRVYGVSQSPASSSSLGSGISGQHHAFPLPNTESGTTPPPSYGRRNSGRRSNSSGNGRAHTGMSGTPSAAAPIPASPIPSPFAAAPPALPSSVHITDGFLWLRLKGRQANHAKHRHNCLNFKRPSTKHLLSPQAYPPPVVASAPDSLSGLFSDMDDGLWARFVDIVRQQVDAALRKQQWRQDKHKDSAPMSCPRF